MDEKIIELLTKIQNDLSEVKIDIKNINYKIDSFFEQTAELTEIRTEMNEFRKENRGKLQEIDDKYTLGDSEHSGNEANGYFE